MGRAGYIKELLCIDKSMLITPLNVDCFEKVNETAACLRRRAIANPPARLASLIEREETLIKKKK